jgi:hypothetical protein
VWAAHQCLVDECVGGERLCFIGRTGAYEGKDMAKTVVLSQRVQRVMWTMLEDCCMGGPKGRIAHGRV